MNLDTVAFYIDRFRKEIQTQPDLNNEIPACQDVYEKWLKDIPVEIVVELGAGASPLLGLFPSIKQLRVSLGEEIGVKVEDMNTPSAEDNACDLIIARHALEHSLMPLIMLCEMARITRKYALVIVPTCSREMAEYPNHYSVFTPVALRALFRRAGLKVVEEELNVLLYGEITEDRFLLEKI